MMQPLVRNYDVPKMTGAELRRITELRAPDKADRLCDEEYESLAIEQNMAENWTNDVYHVMKRVVKANVEGNPPMVYLSIKRHDKDVIAADTRWRDFQAIKNQLVGDECEGVELYPAESRLTDTANQYHLWCIDSPEFRFPFGFNDGRSVTEATDGIDPETNTRQA